MFKYLKNELNGSRRLQRRLQTLGSGLRSSVIYLFAVTRSAANPVLVQPQEWVQAVRLNGTPAISVLYKEDLEGTLKGTFKNQFLPGAS